MREQIATALEKLAQKARGKTVDNESKVAERNANNESMRAWTDAGQGEGLGYPSDISAEHSGDYDALLDDDILECEVALQHLKTIKAARAVKAVHEEIDAHDHVWKPGMLPGAKMVRICRICGVTEAA